jgi:hypothetical protein
MLFLVIRYFSLKLVLFVLCRLLYWLHFGFMIFLVIRYIRLNFLFCFMLNWLHFGYMLIFLLFFFICFIY